MKYVQVVTQMESGGAQRVAILLAEELSKRGDESEIWFLYQKRPTYATMPNVRVLLSHPPKGPSDIIIIVILFIKLLLRHKPNVIISHTHYANIISQPIAWLLGITKRLAVQHNPVETYPQAARIIDLFLGWLGIYKNNIAVSKAVIDSLVNYPKRYQMRTETVENGVTAQTPSESREKVRDKLGIPWNTPVLVNVGRLATQKNQKYLISVLPKIENAVLIIVGDGELRNELEHYAVSLGCKQRIHFTGEVTAQQVIDYLCAADIFLFPSLFEAMPMALIEAMRQGMPVVASDIPATRDVMALHGEEGFAGIITRLEDRENFIKVVQWLISDKHSAEEYGQRARKKSIRYSVEAMADGYQSIAGLF